MSTKPTCPKCGSGISIIYMGAVSIDTENNTVNNGGVLGGIPDSWTCHACDSFGIGIEDLVGIGDQVNKWLSSSYPSAHDALECGHDWELGGLLT